MVNRPTAKKLKTLDELLQADNLTSTPVSIEENGIRMISFDKIRPFKNHPFHLYAGERLEDLVESIKANGILVSMIVRRIMMTEDGYEFAMLAGHTGLIVLKLLVF